MMLAVAGLVASGETVVEEAQAADVSFPQFTAVLKKVGASLASGSF
jgi:5-enolpyruvylshikimate-3-phosphate synthase